MEEDDGTETPETTPPKGSGLRNRSAAEKAPAKTTPAPKPDDTAAPDVTAVTERATKAEARAAKAEGALVALREFSGVLGTTDADVIDTFDAKYRALPKEGRPSRADWIKGLREKPDEAPALLRPFLGGTEPTAEPTRPAGTLGGNGRKVEEPIPAEATKEWQKHGKGLGQSERDYFERVYKPRLAKKKKT